MSLDSSREITIQGQTVLYKNEKEAPIRTVRSIAAAVQYARKHDLRIHVDYVWGDASPRPLYTENEIKAINAELAGNVTVRYQYFNKNTGTSYGHNRMVKGCKSDYLWITNPDIILQLDFFVEIMKPYLEDNDHQIGIVEGRQTPIENRKQYDYITGETSWGTGACTLFRTEAYLGVNGYDEECFFMYCDDVDISWRVRLQGYKIIYVPSAVIFHDKRLSEKGQYVPTSAEIYYSLEARLLMAWKWSYDDLLKALIKEYKRIDTPDYRRALADFEKRKKEDRLPPQLDPEHRVGDIRSTPDGGFLDYGPDRW